MGSPHRGIIWQKIRIRIYVCSYLKEQYARTRKFYHGRCPFFITFGCHGPPGPRRRHYVIHYTSSRIPMVVHQTWKNTHIKTWSPLLLSSVEKWLGVVLGARIAYFLWDDDGVAQFIRQLEPGWAQMFSALPLRVEQSDVFRIMIVLWKLLSSRICSLLASPSS